MFKFLLMFSVMLKSVKLCAFLCNVVLSRWLIRNTIALNVNHHMTPGSALKQSLLVTVLVLMKAQRRD